MLVYHHPLSRFREDARSGDIDRIVLTEVQRALGHSVSDSERRSWHQSLTHMHAALDDPEIPDDAGVGIEFQIPQTSKRIDVILSGRDEGPRDQGVIVELKQWETAEPTEMDGIVRTFLGGTERETPHPSYQAWSYAELLRGFNEAVYEGDFELHPCAYLHNFLLPERIRGTRYRDWVERAPFFGKAEAVRLREFVKKWIRYGDRNEILVRIDGGRLRPSKSLADSLASLMKGNREFTMIDEQKIVYERALDLVRRTPSGEKRVLIVHGGPGTGKSVVAVNLLVALTKDRELVQYVTKNAAPRAVYESMLTGTMSKSRYSNLFRGSGSFTTAERGTFRALIVDEAHRLNEKSGLYQNLGDNQVKELIHAADVTVFFLDEDQRVTLQDIGTRDEIVFWAEEAGAEIDELWLTSQFRCNAVPMDTWRGSITCSASARPRTGTSPPSTSTTTSASSTHPARCGSSFASATGWGAALAWWRATAGTGGARRTRARGTSSCPSTTSGCAGTSRSTGAAGSRIRSRSTRSAASTPARVSSSTTWAW